MKSAGALLVPSFVSAAAIVILVGDRLGTPRAARHVGGTPASRQAPCLSHDTLTGQRGPPVEVAAFEGTYSLVVVSARPIAHDSIVTGRLWIVQTPDRVGPAKARTTPALYGWSDVDLTRLGAVSLAYSPSSPDPSRPGVQVLQTPAKRVLLVFGAAAVPGGVPRDRGVLFTIWRVDSAGIAGYWEDGGLTVPRTNGYFCAVRIDGR